MTDPRRALVIGAGGVGTWLAHGLARQLEYGLPGSALVIVDGDAYEPKNKERQLFTGMGNKAEVLAEELMPHFENTMIIPLPMWVVAQVDEEEKMEDEDTAQGKIAAAELLEEGDVVYAVVDNFKCRKDIFDAAQKFDNIDVFAGGNDDGLFGSVYHYARRNGEDVTEHPAIRGAEYADPPDRNPGELSCQERAQLEGGTQLLATNMAVAAWLLGRTQKVVIQGEIGDEHMIYFDLGLGLAQPSERSAQPAKAPILQGA